MAKNKRTALMQPRDWKTLVEASESEEHRRIRRLLEAPWYRLALRWSWESPCDAVQVCSGRYGKNGHTRTDGGYLLIFIPLVSAIASAFVSVVVFGIYSLLLWAFDLIERIHPVYLYLGIWLFIWLLWTGYGMRSEVEASRATHRKELEEKLSKQLPARDRVADLLKREVETAREELIGGSSSLRDLQRRLAVRIEETNTTMEQLRSRANSRQGDIRDQLEESHGRLKALLGRLKSGKERLDSYIAKVEAFYREATDGLGDLPLLIQARELEQGVENDLAAIEGVVEETLARLSERLLGLEGEVQAVMAGKPEELFLRESSLEQDLARYERLAEAFAEASIPAADTEKRDAH